MKGGVGVGGVGSSIMGGVQNNKKWNWAHG